MNRICMILGLASASLCGCTATQPVASPGALESSPMMLFGAGDDLGLATHLELSYFEGDMTALECLVHFEQCQLDVPEAILTAAQVEFRVLATEIQEDWNIDGAE
ncbi:MAG: hypothetical protein ACPGGL_05530 [Phycisphaerales bacterium]